MQNLNPKDGAYNPGLQFDAFTAGIEDGGLRAKSSISAMVCYILANIEKPLSIKNITDALTAGCIANYFEICDSIDRLKAAGQIVEKRRPAVRYTPVQSGGGTDRERPASDHAGKEHCLLPTGADQGDISARESGGY